MERERERSRRGKLSKLVSVVKVGAHISEVTHWARIEI
jgi:hypothetical protein